MLAHPHHPRVISDAGISNCYGTGTLTLVNILETGRYLITATGILTNQTVLSQIVDINCNTNVTRGQPSFAPTKAYVITYVHFPENTTTVFNLD